MRTEKVELSTMFGIDIVSVIETESKKNGSEKIVYQGLEVCRNSSEFNLSVVREMYRTFSKSIKKAYNDHISLSEWVNTIETGDVQVMLFANLKGSQVIQDKVDLVSKFIQSNKKVIAV